jgi:serine/threonine-protein kinase
MAEGGEPERGTTLTWGGPPTETDAGVELPSRWTLARLLGRGGQAKVWLAHDAELSEWVAVKVFRPDLSLAERERMRREVRLGRTLLHPNLVRVYELLETDGRLVVLMEWVPEGSLAQRMVAGPLTIPQVLQAAEDALSALAFLHERRIVHRDIKPSNLLVDGAGRVRLADLGLVRSLEAGRDLTRTNLTVGTPAYMSPEQLRGADLTAASDLYGLGVTLYELLTGVRPFAEPSEFAVAEKHLHTRPRDPRELRRDCPAWLARFVLRLLEKRPRDRWPTAGAALETFRHQRVHISPRQLRRWGLEAAALLAFAALAAAYLGVIAPRLRRGATVKVEAVGQEVRGLDRRGRTTWSTALASPVMHTERADLEGDGKRETIVTSFSTPDRYRRQTATPSEILVVRDDGGVVTRIHPEDVLGPGWPFPYPKFMVPEPHLLDLDGDGHPEIVVLCPHRTFYPFALLVYWPAYDHWECVLMHSGTIRDIAVVPGSSPPRLRVAGVNNRLGFLRIAAEVVVAPPGSQYSLAGDDPLPSPDVSWASFGKFSYAWYTLLGQGSEPAGLTVEPDGGSVVSFLSPTEPHPTARIDRFGNPVPGPNAGRDLAGLRGWFLAWLAPLITWDVALDAPTLEARVAEIRQTAAPLLAEPPYRAILGETEGRGLARLGRLDDAIRVLRRTFAEYPLEDARFRLVQLLALSGDLDGAIALGTEMVNRPVGDRGTYDGLHLLMRLAIERRDDGLFRQVAYRLDKAQVLSSGDAAALAAATLARAHLWWDELGEADCTVRSWDYAPDGDALAGIARWRLGRTAPGDPEALRAATERNPDAAWEGQVALGGAQLGVGDVRGALATLERTIASLEPLSRDDFMNRQVLDLARAIHVKALEAAGDRTRALAEAKTVRPKLRDGLLPSKLVDEVLGSPR